MTLTIADWQCLAHQNAKAKGFHTRDGIAVDHHSPERIASRIALIHSELSEALECVTHGQMAITEGEHGKPEGLPIELADVAIRLLDLAESLGIDLESAMRQKHDYNRLHRGFRHGGKVL